jgi:hypothetical protein
VELVDNRSEVGERMNRWKWRHAGRPHGAPERTEQKGGFNDPERNLFVEEAACHPLIGSSGVDRRIGKSGVQFENSRNDISDRLLGFVALSPS